MATFEVRTNVPYAVIRYGNKISTFKRTADSYGVVRFEWPDFAVYVNAQKTGHVFSDKILSRLPAEYSWGQTSKWYLVSRFKPTKMLFGLHKLDVPAEKLLEEAEIARRRAEEEARKLKAQAVEAAKRAREAIIAAVDPAIMKIIQDDYYLRMLYETDPSAAISEARDKLATIEAKEVADVAIEAVLNKVVVRLLVWDCFRNIWKPVFGKHWACSGRGVDRASINMSDVSGLNCYSSAGEARRVKLLKPVVFSSGHSVRFIRIGGSEKTSYVDVEITRPTEVIEKVEDVVEKVVDVVEEIPVVVAKLAKTLKITRLVSSVFKGDTATIVGSVAVDGRPADNEPVVLYVDGEKAAETVTKYGIFSFEYKFTKAGSRKLTLESPATDRYPDAGRDVRTVLVSSVPLKLEERLRAEREEYAARREALKRKRIVIPGEYEYKPIFRREELVTSEPEIEPEIIPDEYEPPIPTRGSIQVDLPIPPVAGLPIEVPVAVWLDDMFKGNAPITIDNVRVGSHTVVLKMTGFVSPPINVEVREDEVAHISGIEMIIQ